MARSEMAISSDSWWYPLVCAITCHGHPQVLVHSHHAGIQVYSEHVLKIFILCTFVFYCNRQSARVYACSLNACFDALAYVMSHQAAKFGCFAAGSWFQNRVSDVKLPCTFYNFPQMSHAKLQVKIVQESDLFYYKISVVQNARIVRLAAIPSLLSILHLPVDRVDDACDDSGWTLWIVTPSRPCEYLHFTNFGMEIFMIPKRFHSSRDIGMKVLRSFFC